MTKLSGRFMTSAEVSDRLRITSSTIRAQIGKGKLRAEKRGGIWLFSPAEIDRYARESQTRRKGGRPRSRKPPD